MNRLDRGIPQGEPSPRELLEDHLGKLDVPSLDSLSHSHGVEISGFPGYFSESFKRTFEQVGSSTFVSNSEWFSHFNFLYQTWSATRGTPASEFLPGFAESISSHDSFMQAYGQNTTLQQHSAFNFWTKWFTERVVHPERIIRLHTPISKDYETTLRGIYGYKGTWRSIPSNDGKHTYVEDRVIKEISTLTETLDSSEADLFHTTGSAALLGISQQQALLSARASERRNNPVKTGEYTDRDKDGQLPVGGTYGLDDLYSSAMVDNSYSTIRWFDEYPVVFGFHSNEIDNYLRNHHGWRATNVMGVSADGHRLGDIVPLSLVRAVYTQNIYLDRLCDWSEKNVPGRKVISIEAASLLRTRSDERTTLYKDYPYKFDEPIITDWQTLLSAPAISLP